MHSKVSRAVVYFFKDIMLQSINGYLFNYEAYSTTNLKLKLSQLSVRIHYNYIDIYQPKCFYIRTQHVESFYL